MRYFFRVVLDKVLAALLIALPGNAGADPPSGEELYLQHCASCHGKDRFGAMGPALLPESLERSKPARTKQVIADGLPATQMPGFGAQLKPEEIESLVQFIHAPPAQTPVWDEQHIRASHVIYQPLNQLSSIPVHKADPLNLFMVVESGDHHITVLDGDRLEPLHRFPTRMALHGGIKFSPDGRFAYYSSRDGWISKFDLYTLKPVAEIRAALNTRNIALSHDGRYVLAGNYLPRTLVMLDAKDMRLLKVDNVRGSTGQTSRVSAVYQAAPRHSFVVALKDIPEVWELTYGNPSIEQRRIPVRTALDDFFFDPDYNYLVGADRASRKGQVLNLESGKSVAELDIPGMPHLGSGITWNYKGKRVMATPNLQEGAVSVIDIDDWKIIKRIDTLGPGFFLRSHDNTPYAWVDVFFGPNRDAMQVIDKRSLEIVKTLRPEPGKTSGHVEFTRDGKYALVSIWEMDGALVVYDAASLEEIKRIPMKKPAGKYNVYNKITRSAGTSH
jgi:mono/diheme cytochrome c family protein/DNA-binding beta-propeller fold protein YncE